MARIPGTDCFKSISERVVGADRGLAGNNIHVLGIRSSDFLVGRFSSQKWENLNIIFFNLPVLIVFLDRKISPCDVVAQIKSL